MNKDQFTERVLEPYGISNSTGPRIPVFRDTVTGETYPVYADDLLAMLDGLAFPVKAKVVKVGGSRKAFRVEK